MRDLLHRATHSVTQFLCLCIVGWLGYAGDSRIAASSIYPAIQTCATITSRNQFVAPAGGSFSVNVTASNGCSWTATSSASWLTITAGGSGMGNGTVAFTVQPHADSSGRVGQLTIGDNKFDVNQLGTGAACTTVPIAIGQTRQGVVSDSDCRSPVLGENYADRYTFNGSAGQEIVVSLSFPEQVGFLFLIEPSGAVIDWDFIVPILKPTIHIPSAGGTLKLPASGTYLIEVVSVAGPNSSYSLDVDSAVRTVASVSAASFRGEALAAESIAAAFGASLATTTSVADTLPLPTTLAGTTVIVKDSLGAARAAPLFFVSPGQINYLIPANTFNGAATITIRTSDDTVSTGTVQIAQIAPGLFSANADGQGVAAAVALRIKANGTQSFEPVAKIDSAQNKFVSVPIDLGPDTDQVFLILYGTGIRFHSSLTVVTASIGGTNAQVSYAGPAPDFIGLDQLNIAIPRSLAGRGEVGVILIVDNQEANTVQINIK